MRVLVAVALLLWSGLAVADSVNSPNITLNVNTNLSFFDAIVPCGIRQHGVTSMKLQLGSEIDFGQVEKHVAHEFANVFDRELFFGDAANISRKT